MRDLEDPALKALMTDRRYPRVSKRNRELGIVALMLLWASPEGVSESLVKKLQLRQVAQYLVGCRFWVRAPDGAGYVAVEQPPAAIAPPYTPPTPVLDELEDAQAEAHVDLREAEAEARAEVEPEPIEGDVLEDAPEDDEEPDPDDLFDDDDDDD